MLELDLVLVLVLEVNIARQASFRGHPVLDHVTWLASQPRA